MYIIYKSVDVFTGMVLFMLSRTFFGDIFKFVSEFRNIKKNKITNYNYEEYILRIYKYYEKDYKLNYKYFKKLICFNFNYVFIGSILP